MIEAVTTPLSAAHAIHRPRYVAFATPAISGTAGSTARHASGYKRIAIRGWWKAQLRSSGRASIAAHILAGDAIPTVAATDRLFDNSIEYLLNRKFLL